MSRLKYIFPVLFIIALIFSSCDKIHEFPESRMEIDPTDITAEVEIVCQVELNVETIVTKGVLSPIYSDEDQSQYLRRFNISIIDESKGSDEVVFNDVLYQEVDDMNPLKFNAKLHARKYNFIVWMDYVRRESKSDLFYLTSAGMNYITIHDKDTYSAGSDFKDAQTSQYRIDLSGSKEWFRHIVIDVPLQRPVAKLTFEATDFEDYVKRMGYEGPLDELIKQYSVHILYNGYMATGFNAFTQKMNDASVGYGFFSAPWLMDESGISRLGFDYVFVNGETSSMTVTVEIRDLEGKLINCIDGIVVPTFRGKETVVRMKFFTREYSPGIGINPVFDGEFNVYV